MKSVLVSCGVSGVAVAAVLIAGCVATPASAPPRAPVHRFFADSLVVRGTAEATPAAATCATVAPTPDAVVVELPQDTRATIVLGADNGQALPRSILHVRHLASNRTWCVTTSEDGTPPALAGDFPEGLYAMNVTVPGAPEARHYALSFGKL